MVHTNSSLTHNYAEKYVTFLDLMFKIIDRKIFTDLHIKAGYIVNHYTLLHHYHIKLLIVYSLALRVSTIYSFENDIIRLRHEMKTYF